MFCLPACAESTLYISFSEVGCLPLLDADVLATNIEEAFSNISAMSSRSRSPALLNLALQ